MSLWAALVIASLLCTGQLQVSPVILTSVSDRMVLWPIYSQCLACVVSFISQPSIYIHGWLYGMRMTSVICNVPVLSQNDSTYHHSVFTT